MSASFTDCGDNDLLAVNDLVLELLLVLQEDLELLLCQLLDRLDVEAKELDILFLQLCSLLSNVELGLGLTVTPIHNIGLDIDFDAELHYLSKILEAQTTMEPPHFAEVPNL